MDDTEPGLGVGFAIDTGDSFTELMQLQSFMGSTEAKLIQNAANIEQATGGMVQLGNAKMQVETFGAAATKAARDAAREFAQIERSGEAMVRRLERDNAAFGKSRTELRLLRAEETALAAERVGNADLAQRLREQAAVREAQEYAAIRQKTMAAEAAAEDAFYAAEKAAQASAREAQAVRDAADAYRLFEAVAKQKSAAYRDQQARDAALAMQVEADAVARAAREHANLAALVRGSQGALEADAAAAERLRMSTDPLYAATKRLNDEIAESTRLYYAGATAPAEYARQQEVLTARLRDAEQQQGIFNRGLGTVGATGKLAGHHMANLGYQFQDISIQMIAAAQSSAPLKMAFMALVQQGGQIQMIMSQAGVGIREVGAAFVTMSKGILVATLTNPYLVAGAAAIGAFAGAVRLLQNAANARVDMNAYAESLGLTAKEIRHLDNVTVTFGDTAKAVFQVAGRAIWDHIGPAVTSAWDTMKDWAGWIFSGVKDAANFLIGGMVGAYNTIAKTWRMLPAAMGDAFMTAVNASVDAINLLVRKAIDGINYVGAQANRILPEAFQIPELSAPQISRVTNQYAGMLKEVGNIAEQEMGRAFGRDWIGDAARAAGGSILSQAIRNARARLKDQAEQKGYLDPEKGKKSAADKHAEALAREAQAIEAQIRNLYSLADAYGVSGAAALIAEARVKAETDAIKKRADVEAAVDRQIRLSIAQRVSDAAKSTAGLREQAEAQEAVNAMVAAGIIPATAAADLVKDQLADLPLLAAAQAAQQRGLADEVALANAALDDQRKARLRLREAEEAQRFHADIRTGSNRLAELREELRLVGATSAQRNIALAVLKATQEAETKFTDPSRRQAYIDQQRDIAEQVERTGAAYRDMNSALTFTADKWDLIARNVQNAARGMADAFGSSGRALGDVAAIYADYRAEVERAGAAHRANMDAAGSDAARQREIAKHALATSTMQVGLYGDMAAAAKGFFNEKSAGYRAMMAAEKVFRAFEFAMSVKAMMQDVAETVSSVANSGARAMAAGTEGIANQSKLPFPLNIAAMAATGAALLAAGVAIAGSFGGGKNNLPQSNSGTGTVFGDPAAQSESIKRSIDALKDVDTVMLTYSRQMAASLHSIESQIGGFASLLVRNADSINASGGVTEGFKANAIGSVLGAIPLVGGILKGLFGTKTTVIGSGLFADAQSIGSILSGGFDAQYYSDVQKKKKFLGLTTSNKFSTQYSAADPTLENQFTLILRSFNDAIAAAAVPLGESTEAIQARLRSFVVNIGKIDLQGLTGAQIEEKLNAVFGAAADNMARAAFPMIQQFQKVGEGAFETLVRVASTLEAVGSTLDLLGQSATGMGIAAKLGLADQFESVSALTSAVDSYFSAFYTREEQAAARTAQMGKVFESLGFAMPATLAGFRELVEAQNLTTAAGQAAYATLLKLAPAFADLQAAMDGAKSAADILAERHDLERKLLELLGDTAALRALDLAKLDPSNRALQEQIWAIQDAQEAAKAAEELRKAWTSVGDSIMDEVKRIRGLNDATGAGGFAAIMGQFNAATIAARGGDMDAAKALPQLSQALLTAAADAATSRQELDRVRAQTAASLEATYGLVNSLAGNVGATSDAALLNAAGAAQGGTAAATSDNGAASLAARLDELRDESEAVRRDLTAALATIAGHTGKTAKKLDDITSGSGGNAVAVEIAA